MSQHPEAQDMLHVRGLLAEAGVEESPELVERLLALRLQSRVAAPEPDGELAALFAGNPVPLRPRPRRGRGMILGAALIGAMAVGAGGVAANPDFLIRADPTPEVTFTPEAPTLERAEPAAPEAVTDPLPPATVPAPGPAPIVEAVPVPAPVPVPEPQPEPEPQQGIVPAPGVAPGNPPLPGIGGGKAIFPDPPRGDDLHGNPNAADRGQDSKRAGAGPAGDRGSSRQDPGPGSGRGNDRTSTHGHGESGRDR